ncbi:hypothetical protein EDC18_11054 [Natranaerovirga pectinivora]|uniref:ECF transporter S component n=1 Tax=Natranaerovirga pectinivora TaxID=682400 RepID=A0A4R3MK09_9FIRM|nr:ECF transporter S component [Natranaerovirga pectinivora]TCT12980.1 hypothetical protein EDC18_11054 [Natranaerovirga pectinivora]
METKKITLAAMMIALIIVVQQIGIQYIVGPAVNGILVFSVMFLGLKYAVIISLFSPFLAHLFGIMRILLVVPFIAASNMVYVIIFQYTYKINKYISIFLAAFIKFLVLYLAVNYFLEVPATVKMALGTPQFYTAIIGGLIGVLLAERVKKITK